MLTLWDLLEPVVKPVVDRWRGRNGLEPAGPRRGARGRQARPAPPACAGPSGSTGASAIEAQAAPDAQPKDAAKESAQERYDRITREMLAEYGVKVRRWRHSMSGMAWELRYADGSRKRLIEAPRPRGPMSAAVFLHEIGHHAIGFDRYKPRCLEEYHAWAWSIAAMRRHGLNVTDAVLHRMHESLWYAVAKARRRGIKGLPPELEPYQIRPARRRRARVGPPEG